MTDAVSVKAQRMNILDVIVRQDWNNSDFKLYEASLSL